MSWSVVVGRLGDVDPARKQQQMLRCVDLHLELQELDDAGVNVAAPLDSVDDGVEVVVEEQDVAGLLGNARTAVHGKSHVCQLERRRIVRAIPRHCHHLIRIPLERCTDTPPKLSELSI